MKRLHLRSHCVRNRAELSQITDESAKTIARLPRLEKLYLGGCLSNHGLENLQTAVNLDALTIESFFSPPEVDDDGLRHLNKLVKLKTLCLFRGNLTPAGLEKLDELTQLVTLDVLNLSRELRLNDADLKGFQRAHPSCRIQFDDFSFKPNFSPARTAYPRKNSPVSNTRLPAG